MKTTALKMYLMPAALCLMLLSVPTKFLAADQNAAESDERLRRIEQRLNELAERQEQLMRRFGGPPQPQGSMPQPGPMPQPGMMPQRGTMPQPNAMPQPGTMAQPGMMPQPGMIPQPGMMPPTAREKVLHGIADMLRLMVLAWIVCNVLLAVWIYTDIRKRGEGSGIFVALALVAGIPAAIIYSLVRIADKASVAGK